MQERGTMTSDAASGHQGLWTKPTYPGDTVRCLMLYRRDATGRIELGDVRIQVYDSFIKVGMFLPGIDDGHHVWPEKHQETKASPEADNIYDRYVQEAYAAGWQNYHPEQHSLLRDKREIA
jgi:hypothetical protein